MAKFIDITGQKFGRLTVIQRAKNKNNRVMWTCQCDCGNILDVRSDQLRRGVTKSCGCLQKENSAKIGKSNFKDLSNKRFGKLVAISPQYNEKTKKYFWICKCDCGNIITALGTSLSSGNTQSCGCVKSIGEQNIQKILNSNNINYVYQYKVIIDNKNYIYDFAIIENNKISRLIEFDGIQHFGRISGWFTEERYALLQYSDDIKNQYALENNIDLVRIPYTERDNITLEILLGNQYLVK